MKELDGYKYYDSLTSGALTLLGNQEELNRINVFPVPDGDTGTNLASTMKAILEISRRHQSISESAKSIADAALIGARGNSGAIFAQFFHGLRTEIGNRTSISTAEIPNVFKKAVEYAYKAVLEPVEGTVLTILKVWSNSFYDEFQKAKDFLNSFKSAYYNSLEALDKTPEQLAVLKESNVVDAGGKGFLIFLEGVLYYLKTGVKPAIESFNNNPDNIIFEEKHVHEKDITYRYCTEALINIDEKNIKTLKKITASLGDSVVIANNDQKMRIHLHTNDPAEFFYRIKDYGDIVQQKVDDMKMQYQISNERKYPIALVTDSSCDIPDMLIDKYQIQMVPLQLNFGPVSYLDKLTIKPEQFYKMLNHTTYYPTSSQPNIRKFQNLYSFLMSHYDQLIAIHISSRLSGTFNLSQNAAEHYLNGNKKLTIIDSKQDSGAQGLIVEEAAEMIEKGLTYDEIVNRLSELIPKTKILVSVKTLDGMVKGGRVSPVKGLLAKLMNLKPVISLDSEGSSELYGKGFSDRSNRKVIFNLFREMHERKGIKRYCITHANNLKEAEMYEEIARAITGKDADYIYNLSPVIGAHSGIGAVAISYITN
jgi:DegV family protein with EDD domain